MESSTLSAVKVSVLFERFSDVKASTVVVAEKRSNMFKTI